MVVQPFAQAPPPGRRVPIWAWILGGCGVLLVLGVALIIVVSVLFARNFQTGSVSCLSKDFPVYAGASYQRVNTYVGTGGSTCTVVLDAAAPSTDVTSYYQEQLNMGKWKTTGYDPSQGVLSFTRVDKPNAKGTVRFLGHGTSTEIDIQYNY